MLRECEFWPISILLPFSPSADVSRFLAARLHLESLTSKTNRRAVRKALHELPTTLYGNYDDAMERIKQQPTQTLALRVLSWIVYAARPLQLKELQHAIAVDELEPDDRSISEESLTPPSILINACAGMIKIDEASNIIGLVHKTTQEYFDQNGPKHFPHAQSDIGTRCLKYLSLEVFSEGACSTYELYKRRLSENVLLEYAAQNLGDHMHGMDEHTLNSLKLEVFLDKHKLSCATQALFVDRRQWFSAQTFPKNFCGVHYAAYFGLKDILRLLLVNPKVDRDTKDSYGRTPLSWAAANGHEAVVKLLLETGKVDVDLKDGRDQTPLSRAAANGHEAVVKLLLEKVAKKYVP
jgi:Ankyrin repeats (3 copies)